MKDVFSQCLPLDVGQPSPKASGMFKFDGTNSSAVESKVSLGGTAVLTIDHGTYRFVEPHTWRECL
jgi:hypothetical protein